MNLGKRIKQIRRDFKLSQTEFAQKLGSTFGAVSKYEIDKVTPNNVFINLLSHEFNVNKHWLITGEGEMYKQTSKVDLELMEILGHLVKEVDPRMRDLILDLNKLSDEDLMAVSQIVGSIIQTQKIKRDGL